MALSSNKSLVSSGGGSRSLEDIFGGIGGGFQDVLSSFLGPLLKFLSTGDYSDLITGLAINEDRGQAEEFNERALGLAEGFQQDFRRIGDWTQDIAGGLPTINLGGETLFSLAAGGLSPQGRTTPMHPLQRVNQPKADFMAQAPDVLSALGLDIGGPTAPTAPAGSTTPAPEGINVEDYFTTGEDYNRILQEGLEEAGISLGGISGGVSTGTGRGKGVVPGVQQFTPGVGIDVGASLGLFDESLATGREDLTTGLAGFQGEIDESRGLVGGLLDRGFLDPGELASQLDLDNILKAELQGLGRAGATSLQSGRENIASMAGQYGGLENVQLQQANLAQTLQGITGGLGLEAKAHDTIRRADLAKVEAQINQALAGIGAGIEGQFGLASGEAERLTGGALANLEGQYAFRRPEIENLLASTNYNMKTGLASLLANAGMMESGDKTNQFQAAMNLILQLIGAEGGLAGMNLQALGGEAGAMGPWNQPMMFSETSTIPWMFPDMLQVNPESGSQFSMDIGSAIGGVSNLIRSTK